MTEVNDCSEYYYIIYNDSPDTKLVLKIIRDYWEDPTEPNGRFYTGVVKRAFLVSEDTQETPYEYTGAEPPRHNWISTKDEALDYRDNEFKLVYRQLIKYVQHSVSLASSKAFLSAVDNIDSDEN
jgi:hypothetical protein